MCLHQALKQPDRNQFVQAVQKEWDDQFGNGNFDIILRSEVPEGGTMLPAVWQMKRKRDMKTKKAKKCKARLNIDGSQMKEGVHCDKDKIHAPVASWNSVCTLLALISINDWHTTQIDCVLAFPQAPVEREMHMEIPKGFEIEGNPSQDCVLRLNKNVHGQKQAGRVWNDYLVDTLVNKLKFVQSKVDERVFYRGKTMCLLHTDDSTLAGPDKDKINETIWDMKAAKLNTTVEGDLQDFLGANIEQRNDGSVNLTQPHLIDSILEDLQLTGDDVHTKDTPAASSKLSSRHSDSPSFDNSFNYQSVTGKLGHLDKGSRSDISCITHQCARFSIAPKEEHGKALKWVGRHLKGTRDKGALIKPDKSRGLEVHVGADFSGNWDPKETQDQDTARSRHGCVISHMGCPILWKSQLQGETSLSSTESEHDGLSCALRDAIPIMELSQEMRRNGFNVAHTKAQMHCKVFEDNSGALEIAKVAKHRSRTKHLNCKLHRFRSCVDEKKEITIHPMRTQFQQADMLAKPNDGDALCRHRKVIMNW